MGSDPDEMNMGWKYVPINETKEEENSGYTIFIDL